MNKSPMRIAVSPTLIKVIATQNAARRATADTGVEITIIESKKKFKSRIPEQPGNIVEATIGAFNRAEPLLDADDARDATHAIGAENTATYMGLGLWSDPCVVLLLGRDGKKVAVPSVGFPMPNKELGHAISANHEHTAGGELGARLQCDGANWHKTMSGGLTPRDRLIEDAVYTVIVYTIYGVEMLAA